MFNSSHFFFTEFYRVLPSFSLSFRPSFIIYFSLLLLLLLFFFATSPRSPPNTFHGVNTSNPPHPPPPSAFGVIHKFVESLYRVLPSFFFFFFIFYPGLDWLPSFLDGKTVTWLPNFFLFFFYLSGRAVQVGLWGRLPSFYRVSGG